MYSISLNISCQRFQEMPVVSRERGDVVNRGSLNVFAAANLNFQSLIQIACGFPNFWSFKE